MRGARNVKGGLVLLFAGVAGGLLMAVYAFEPIVPPPDGLVRYDDLPRRLVRLAHIAAVMLPLINITLGPWLDRLVLSPRLAGAASWLLLAGALGLPPALVVQAVVPAAGRLHLSGIPATTFVAGLAIVALGAWRTDLTHGGLHAHAALGRTDGEGDRRGAFQGAGGRARPRHAAS